MLDVNELMVPHIRRLKTYQGVDPMEVMAEQAGIPPEKVIRLNGNENPYGPSPTVAVALGEFQNYNHYPDPGQRRLREALSDYVDAPAEQIVAGNGSDELIDLLLRMFLGPGENIIIPTPTFGMYAFSAEVCGGEAIAVPRDKNFEIDIEATKLAMTPATKGIFLPSPNNPTGNIATEVQIRALLETGLLVVVDEAYFEFCGETVLPLVQEYSNLVVLRTFSKWAGLAGLRIGLGVMNSGRGFDYDGHETPVQRQPAGGDCVAGIVGRPVRPAGEGPLHRRRARPHDGDAAGNSGSDPLALPGKLHPVPAAGGQGPGNI